MAEIDSLEISISSSAEDATKKINSLASALENIKNSLSKSDIEEIAKKLQAIQQIKLTVSPDSGTAVDALTEKVNALQRAVEQINSTPLKVSNSPDTGKDVGENRDLDTSSATDTSEKLGILANAADLCKEAFARFTSTERFTTNESSALMYGLDSLRIAVVGLGGVFASGIGKGISYAADELKKFGNKVLDVTKNIGKFVASIPKNIGTSIGKSLVNPFKNAIKTVTTWKNAIGRIAVYRIIRGAIKAVTDGFSTGIKNLYEYSKLVGTEFAPAMDRLATSSLYLKNSLGAMAAPLIQAVAPAVDYLVDKFVELLNVIGKAMAALTGKDVYTQAKKHAVEYEDAANSATKAAKEFQRYLIGIDELNIINDPNKGRGGISALEDYGSMFEEVQVPTETMDWAAQVREAIENGDWYSVGATVAQKLNEAVSSLDTYSWGMSLAARINEGLSAASGFVNTFDFSGLGGSLATGLNGIFDGIDWTLIGTSFAAQWNSLFDLIYGFVTTLDWASIGLGISNAINGFFEEIDLGMAAEGVSEAIKGVLDAAIVFVGNLDVSGITQSIITWAGKIDWLGIAARVGALAAEVVARLPEFILSALGGITQLIADGFSALGLDSVAGFFQGISDKLFGLADWLKENFIDPFVNGIKNLLGIHSPSTVIKEIGENTIAGFLNGIKAKWSDVTNLIESKISGIKTTFQNLTSNAKTWGKDLASNMANGIRGAISAVESAVKAVADKIADFLGFSEPDLGPLSNFHTYMPDMLQLMAKGIRENTSLATNAVSDLAGSVSKQFSNMEIPKPRFSNPAEMQMNYSVAYANGGDEVRSRSYADTAGGRNDDVVNALFAVATQIVTAINNKEFEATLDGEKVTKHVTAIQEQKARMYRR